MVSELSRTKQAEDLLTFGSLEVIA
uniref:Uncharacterized protein n=1 Tax=Anguilla anguilla TaxID=7936 RepID=A0A0E9SGB8_ANGAN